MADYEKHRRQTDKKPLQDDFVAFARNKHSVTGHRKTLREEYRRHFGQRRGPRPSK
jgi:hypothetical protein